MTIQKNDARYSIYYMSLTEKQIAHREYLNSPAWKEIRQKVLERDGYECQKCHNPGSDVHHKTYEHWGKEPLDDLVTLCRPCHDNHHILQKEAIQRRKLGKKARRVKKNKQRKSNRAIGTRAIWNYLTPYQKDLIIKEFNLSGEIELYNQIYLSENDKICKLGAKLLGYNNWYSQLINKKPVVNNKSNNINGPSSKQMKKARRMAKRRERKKRKALQLRKLISEKSANN